MSFQEYAEHASHHELRHKWATMTKPVKLGIIAIALICLGAVLFMMLHVQEGADPAFQIEKAEANTESAVSVEEAPSSQIHVHVTGCVNAPGMYVLSSGARLSEAVSAAGGFTEDALEQSVNLARELEDGEQIIVESQDAAVQTGNDAALATSTNAPSLAADGRVDINTADADLLQTISGIGPSKAQKIIAYREANGAFKSVEELCNVSGIGEKTLASIKDQIRVG